jgi:hypothetical protein
MSTDPGKSPGRHELTPLKLPDAKPTLKMTIKDTQILLDTQYNPFAVRFAQ